MDGEDIQLIENAISGVQVERIEHNGLYLAEVPGFETYLWAMEPTKEKAIEALRCRVRAGFLRFYRETVEQ